MDCGPDSGVRMRSGRRRREAEGRVIGVAGRRKGL